MKFERESPKRTIFASGGLGPLQMVSEPDTGDVPARTMGFEGGGFGGRSHIGWRKE